MIRKEGNTIGISNISKQQHRTTRNLISLEGNIQRMQDLIRILEILETLVAQETVFPLKISSHSMKIFSESLLKIVQTNNIKVLRMQRKTMKKLKKLILKKIMENSFIMIWNLIFSVMKKILIHRISLKILEILRKMKVSLRDRLDNLQLLVLQKRNEKKVKILMLRFT